MSRHSQSGCLLSLLLVVWDRARSNGPLSAEWDSTIGACVFIAGNVIEFRGLHHCRQKQFVVWWSLAWHPHRRQPLKSFVQFPWSGVNWKENKQRKNKTNVSNNVLVRYERVIFLFQWSWNTSIALNKKQINTYVFNCLLHVRAGVSRKLILW